LKSEEHFRFTGKFSLAEVADICIGVLLA